MNRVDTSFSDIEQLEGGKPPSKSEIGLREFVSEVPDSLARLFTTKDGWTLLLYAFATGVGLAAIDFNIANAMVEKSLNHGVGKMHGKNHAGFSGGVDGDGVVHLDDEFHSHRGRHGGIDTPLANSNVRLDLIASAGVQSGLGLSEVDRVQSLVLGDGGMGDQILTMLNQKSVEDSSGQSAVALLINPSVVQLSDTTLVDASTRSDHLRTMRGGFDTITLESTHIVFGTAPNGQAVVVLAEKVDGSLTGFKDGSENGRIFGMQFGSGEASNLLGILTTIDGVEVFQPLLDPTSGRVLVPTGTIENGIASYMADLKGGNKPLAQVIALEGYESPAFNALQDMVAEEESGRFTLTSVEDGLLFDGKPTGVSVDSNGVMTIDINGSDVVIDQSQIHLNNDGLQIDGFADENHDGNWELAESPVLSTEAGQFVQKMMVDLKIPEGELDLKLVDGKLVCTEVATGDVVCDENGLFTLDYMQEVLTRLDIVGGPSELPDRNSGRPNQIKYGSPIKAYSVQMAIDFRQAYIDQFGIDPFDGSLQNGKIERILIGNDKWATAMGKPENGESVFRNLAFRLEADPSKVVWYPISPTTASQIDAIWSD